MHWRVVQKAPWRRASSRRSPMRSRHMRRYAGRWDERQAEKASNAGPSGRRKAHMTDSTDELMKSYEVIRSIVMRHSQYDAARILTLNLATCITTNSRQDETRMGEGALQPHRACSMAKNLW